MQLIFGQDELVCQWVGERVGFPVQGTTIGGTLDGVHLCGGAVFSNYSGASVEMTLATEHCWSRGAIRALFHYAFVQRGCLRLSVQAKRSNKIMRRIIERMGFVYEGLRPNFYGHGKANDAVLYGLTRDKASKYL